MTGHKVGNKCREMHTKSHNLLESSKLQDEIGNMSEGPVTEETTEELQVIQKELRKLRAKVDVAWKMKTLLENLERKSAALRKKTLKDSQEHKDIEGLAREETEFESTRKPWLR